MNANLLGIFRIFAWSALLAITACASPPDGAGGPSSMPSEGGSHEAEGVLLSEAEAPPPSAELRHLCAFGLPNLTMALIGREFELIARGGYTILHDNGRKVPLYVCEKLSYADVHGPLTGRAAWYPDPQLCDSSTVCGDGAVDDDYRGSGFDRGHLAPNMNQRASERKKADVFFFSNAAPQVGSSFNRTVWRKFEEDLTVLTCAVDQLWTITGVAFFDEEDRAIIHPLQVIGDGEVAVPTHFYKIVAWMQDGHAGGFAVVMENQSHPTDSHYADFVRPVVFVEEMTGIDFSPEVADQKAVFAIGPEAVPATSNRDRCNELCPEGARCP